MPVVELLISAILPVLFDKLTSLELLQFLRQEGLYSKIKTLEETLKMIQAVLGYAEGKQLENKHVKDWLDDLEDLAYDVEDILDEFATEVLARKLEMKNRDQASSSKVRRKFVPGFFKKLSPRAIKFRTHIGSEIKDVKRRLERVTSQLEQLCKLKDGLGLEKNIAGGTSAIAHQRQPTTCIPIEPTVCGRHEDKAKILEMVFKDEPSVSNFHVISIVGMGGIGKTTLARQVYNDKAAESFDLKAWVCISNDFDVQRISKTILESITKSSNDLKDLSAVQILLQEKFAGKKFLLVLDDIWSKDYNSWEILRSPFKVGASGSKIIVTTRHEDVALTIGQSTRLYRLKHLSNDDCWSLFKAHAFEDGVNSTHHDIQSIREKVIEKSKGLPLASRILGGLLRAKQIDKWLEILNSKMWDFEDKGEIPTTLKLSYFYLSSHLKRCFAHCAILPEDYEFQEEEVILLWITEGLIQPSEENKQLEDLGHDYFNDLESRSLFQQSSSDESKYIMHDLVNDLARWASGRTCSRLEDMSRANKQLGSLKKVRHLSYAQNYVDGICKFNVISGVEQIDEQLRTFLPFQTNQRSKKHYISQTIIFDLLPKFKKLRMLSLEGYRITELPESFGDLRHLRYLNLSGTKIESLPESTSFLINLFILKLKDCFGLRKLPSKIQNLTKLRYLDIRGVNLDEMPWRINELKHLQYLSDFIVGKGVGATLKDLKNLKSLCGELHLSGLSNVVDLQETNEMILNDKQKLRVLELEWNSQFDDTRNEEIEKKVLELLHPHPNLEGLKIKFYCGIEFPSWVGDTSFSKLTTVTLIRCDNCTFLPSLGLLESLKYLTISEMNGLKSIGKEFCGLHCSRPFQSLETLCFKDLQEWEHWEPTKENQHGGAFLCLREFSVINCPKLHERLPDYLPSLEKFVVKNCEQLVVSLSSLPMLSNLDIDNCREIACNSPIDSRLLNYMTFSNIPGLSSSSRQVCFQGVKRLRISNTSHEQLTNLWQMYGAFLERPPQWAQNFTSITDLTIFSCSALASFPESCFFSNIRKLDIIVCNALISLPVEINHKNTCLESLAINSCNSLRFMVNGQLPSSLKRLEIYGCDNLEYLWDDRETGCTSILDKENNMSLLEYLDVFNCISLASLSLSARLPVTLSTLWISNVPKLESIADSFHNNKSLEEIAIFDCKKLKTIPKGLYDLTRLQKISIYNCQSIVNFAEDGLPKDGLSLLTIQNCEKLEGLPKGFHNLYSLKSLDLDGCPSLRSFPEEGFPTNLTSLTIKGEVNLCKPLLEWGFHKLTSLTTLHLSGGQEAELSILEQDMEKRLPHSLTHLHLHQFPNVKWVLRQGLRNLELLEINGSPNLTSFPKVVLSSSLQSLIIWNCLGLTSISELRLPSSLQSLLISNCPSLTSISELSLPSSFQSLSIGNCPGLTSILELSLPSSLQFLGINKCLGLTSISKQRLPSSLLRLSICDCPRLKEECKRNKGKEWSKISHIPCIEYQESVPEKAGHYRAYDL